MDKETIKKMIQAEVASQQSHDQFNISKVPFHTHNNLDAPNIPISSIANDTEYVALNRITLTPTQIKALKTTPLTIIPAPVPATTAALARTLIIVEDITGYLSYGGTAFTGANALEFRYTGASGAKVTADVSTTFLNAAASAYVNVAGVTTELVPVSNAPIVVCVPTADPATGNSTITFVIKYHLVRF